MTDPSIGAMRPTITGDGESAFHYVPKSPISKEDQQQFDDFSFVNLKYVQQQQQKQ
jgi:hypothetical protein